MEEQLNQLANSINPQTFLVGFIFIITAAVVYVFPPKKNQLFLRLPYIGLHKKSRSLGFLPAVFGYENDADWGFISCFLVCKHSNPNVT